MRVVGAVCAALLASGCNAILGNGNFQGPEGPIDAAEDGASDAPADACSGIGCMVANCAGQGKPPTSVSGTVFAPDGLLRLHNALVYVPTAPLDALGDGPANPACASGNPAVFTRTDVSGRFKLDNVPSVPNLPLVIQVGKWRRQITVPAVNECADLALPISQTRLPRNSSEGHLPRIAVSTANAETLECALRHVGVSDTEHSIGTGAGRIHLYAELTSPIDFIGTATLEPVSSVYNRMQQYDMVLFGCDGTQATGRPQQTLLDYVNSGGWAWLSHFQAGWLVPRGPFPAFASFDFTVPSPAPPLQLQARIDTSSSRGQALSDWMVQVGGSTAALPDQVSIESPRTTCRTVDTALAVRHVYFDPAISSGYNMIQMLSWSPAGGGRLVFSDVHLEAPVGASTFPGECLSGPLTAHEKLIAYQLFDQPTCMP